MDASEFREFGRAAVDFVADYIENIRDRDVTPNVKPGYLQPLIGEQVPEKGEPWENLLKDMERVIMPGITHWHSPNFHAYYPTGNSYPSIVAELLSAGLGVIGFNWMASPACTELEVAVMNWLGKLLGLPDVFLNCSEGPGGGVIQATASEATLIGLLAAKERMVLRLRKQYPQYTEADIKGKLIAYSCDQSNSSIEKAGLIGSMTMRLLKSDNNGTLPGDVLRDAIKKDIAAGLIPCYCVATLGTTPTCAFDDLEELGLVCEEFGVWMHVDAAYAGTCFSCPEYRHYLKGVEYAESFNFNPHKMMMVNFDCSALWVKNARYLVEAFNVERIYLEHKHVGAAPDYMHWQIPLGRKFRALKLWFVLRSYGVEGIRKHVRKQVGLAKHFETMMRADKRFEIFSSSMGLVCFYLKGSNDLTKKLYDAIINDKKIFVVPGNFHGKYLIRFAVTSRLSETADIEFGFRCITSLVDNMLNDDHCPLIEGKNEITKMQIDYHQNDQVEKTK